MCLFFARCKCNFYRNLPELFQADGNRSFFKLGITFIAFLVQKPKRDVSNHMVFFEHSNFIRGEIIGFGKDGSDFGVKRAYPVDRNIHLIKHIHDLRDTFLFFEHLNRLG